MPSIFSHAVSTVGLASCFYRPAVKKWVWGAGIMLSVLPDVDVIGFRFGIQYSDFWGHRGFTHSLVCSVLLTVGTMTVVLRGKDSGANTKTLFAFFLLAVSSHGVLDAMTDGGLGVAFFSPFENSRYFLPWRPIHVSPIGVARFFSGRGLSALESEALWIWLPTLVVVLLSWAVKSLQRRSNGAGLRRG